MVYFYTKIKLNNYIDSPEDYVYQKSQTQYGFGIHLELLETNYPYYILKNYGIDNIELVDTLDHVKPNDLVIFYNCCENKAKLQLEAKECIKIQIVTDTPIIHGCDGYIAYDPSVLQDELCDQSRYSRVWWHVMYPMPILSLIHI